MLQLVKELWREFGDVPMDPETECIEVEWIPARNTQRRNLALV